MILRELNGGSCKTYLVADEGRRRAVLVDPLYANVDRYLALLGYHRLTLDLVIDTHTHADHLSGCAQLRFLVGAPFAMQKWAPSPAVDRHLEDGDEVAVGGLAVRVLHTPGHTPDGMSLVVEGNVLTGDTLFIGGSGRADFPGGDAGAQFDSITRKLFTLPDETAVHPGHDYRGNTRSTIGEERRTNPRLANRTRGDYVELMDNLRLAPPQNIQEVLQPNQSALGSDQIHFPDWSEIKKVREVQVEGLDLMRRSDTPPLVVDVREPAEYTGELGHLPGSVLIPLRELMNRLREIEGHKAGPVVTVCRAGMRSATAAAILGKLGFTDVSNLAGGMLGWRQAGLPVELQGQPVTPGLP